MTETINTNFIVKRTLTGDKLTDDKLTDDTNSIYSFEDDTVKVEMEDDTYANIYRNSIRWNFGDGTYVEGKTATHYYKNPGKYTISCTFYKLDKTPVLNENTFTIIVKEIYETKLEIENPPTNNQIGVSKNNKLFKLKCQLGKNIVTKPSVVAKRVFDKETVDNETDEKTCEKHYFDIKNKPFYNLERYYTFLEKRVDYNHYAKGEEVKYIFTPVTEYTPAYAPVYGYLFVDENNEVNLKTTDSNDPNAKIVGYKADIEIWYKNDNNNAINDLYFYYNSDTLKIEDEVITSDFYLNMPPIGAKYETVEVATTDKESVSLNGIVISDEYLEKNVEKHLANSLYKNTKIYFYHGNYVLNDDGTTYNLYKQGTITEVNAKNIKLEEDLTYCKKYSLESSEDEIQFKNGITFTLKDLNEVVIPTEKMNVENIDELLECYMPHLLFQEKDNVKVFLKNILSNGNFLNYVTTKGLHFFDDMVNIKTCYLEKLISSLEMLGEDINLYNDTSFNNCNELRDLTRILSMNYCDLFGNTYNELYDIRIKGDIKGKNVGDEIKLNDALYCDANYKIKGLRRDGKYYDIPNATSKLIVRDDFNGSSRLVSLEQIPCYSYDANVPDSWDWSKHIYTIEEYDTSWNWNLVLPKEFNSTNNREKMIHDYYSFYLLKPNEHETRHHNFLDEDTIPSNNSVETWDKEFGVKHDFLMKLLYEKLLD